MLSDVVKQFLSLALTHPEKPPRTQRAERENQAMIVGYNRAQEDLRTILERHGAAEDIKALAKVRGEGQLRPMKIGDTNVWPMS